jgi:hypothetical protein
MHKRFGEIDDRFDDIDDRLSGVENAIDKSAVQLMDHERRIRHIEKAR